MGQKHQSKHENPNVNIFNASTLSFLNMILFFLFHITHKLPSSCSFKLFLFVIQQKNLKHWKCCFIILWYI